MPMSYETVRWTLFPLTFCAVTYGQRGRAPNTTRSCGRGPPSPLTCRRRPCAVRRGTLSLLRPCGAAQWASFVPYIPHGNVFFIRYSLAARAGARRPPSIAATLARRAPSQLPHATLARRTFPIYRARRWRGGHHLSPRRWRGAPPSQRLHATLARCSLPHLPHATLVRRPPLPPRCRRGAPSLNPHPRRWRSPQHTPSLLSPMRG